MISVGQAIPFRVEIQTRVRDESIEGDNPFRWETVTVGDLFADKRSLVIALPGAFTPTCSNSQVPDFVEKIDEIKSHGIDKIYILSVNDAFVMYKWMEDLGVLGKIDYIPDGNCNLTSALGMAVSKDNLGFGQRSWRYAMIIDHHTIEATFIEEGLEPNCETDPYEESTPEKVLEWLEMHPSIVKPEPEAPEEEAEAEVE